MKFRQTHRQDVAVIRICQDALTQGDVAHLKRVFDGLEAGEEHRVVVDLSLVNFIDSCALGTMVEAWRRSDLQGHQICWAHPTIAVRNLLELMALQRAIRIFPYVIHACRWFELRDKMGAVKPLRRSA